MSAAPKRFYRDAAPAPLGENWQVELNGRALRTPARAVLELPSRRLAEAVAQEWREQGEALEIPRMHLTRLANVAVDRTPLSRREMADELTKYCETDLLCHLAEAPVELRARQEAAWRTIRDWAGPALGIMLMPVQGIMAAPQPAASLDAARDHAMSRDDYKLTGLAFGCALFGSALLALAVEQGEIAATDALARSQVDETFQAEQWGRDSEAEAALQARREQAEALGNWFSAL